jgi:hypothetical protein
MPPHSELVFNTIHIVIELIKHLSHHRLGKHMSELIIREKLQYAYVTIF